MSNYTEFAARIRRAKTKQDIVRLHISLTRLYDAGIFSVAQMGRLDQLIVDKENNMEQIAQLEEKL